MPRSLDRAARRQVKPDFHLRDLRDFNRAPLKPPFPANNRNSKIAAEVFRKGSFDPAAFGRAVRRIDTYADVVRPGARRVPWWYVLEAGLLGWELYEWFYPVEVPAPLFPDNSTMVAYGWNTGNWPPPFLDNYTRTHTYGRNQDVGFFNYPDLSLLEEELPAGDWSSVNVGDGVFPIVAGEFQIVGEPAPATYYATQGYAIRTSTSVDPFAPITVVQPILGPDNELNPNFVRHTLSPPVEVVPVDPAETPFRQRALEFGPRQVRPVTPAGRQPPGRNTKERKGSTTERIARVIFAALDVVSEYAEIVDAFYQGLPDHIRRRWEGKAARWFEYDDWGSRDPADVAARKKFGTGVDQFGQYGIDGADWKLQAIWYNWDAIDLDVAFRELLINQGEDWFIGTIHKFLPKHRSGAFDQEIMDLWSFYDELIGNPVRGG